MVSGLVISGQSHALHPKWFYWPLITSHFQA